MESRDAVPFAPSGLEAADTNRRATQTQRQRAHGTEVWSRIRWNRRRREKGSDETEDLHEAGGRATGSIVAHSADVVHRGEGREDLIFVFESET